jgi:hypothetical protein
MTNATDYMASVRDAANELADKLGEAVNANPELREEINASLRMFAHAVLDAAEAERA